MWEVKGSREGAEPEPPVAGGKGGTGGGVHAHAHVLLRDADLRQCSLQPIRPRHVVCHLLEYICACLQDGVQLLQVQAEQLRQCAQQ